jgi:hypothetical protein
LHPSPASTARVKTMGRPDHSGVGFQESPVITAPATPEAERWAGWGTALKPAHEPICVARKPLVGTVAQNVQAYGTGAINVDKCRIGRDSGDVSGWSTSGSKASENRAMSGPNYARDPKPDASGRWPANVILSDSAAAALDAQSGERKAGVAVNRNIAGKEKNRHGIYRQGLPNPGVDVGYGDIGGASRFFLTVPDLPIDGEDVTRFRYVPKSSRSERNAGLDGMPERECDDWPQSLDGNDARRAAPRANHHPTLKPIALMKWLITLVTPPGGTVLDPFAGSGSTGCAAAVLGVDFIGIEQDAEYAAIAERRIAYWAEHGKPKTRPQLPLFAEQAAD